MAELTDPAANKNNIVTPDEAQAINDHLNQMNAKRLLPCTFVVTDIQPAPAMTALDAFWHNASRHVYVPIGPVGQK